MNERIKELVVRAGNYGSRLPERFVLEDGEIEEFAKLIIRGCLEISQETCNVLKADESLQMPGFKTSMNLYNVTFCNSLTEHFGVD